MITQSHDAPSISKSSESLARYYRTLAARLAQYSSFDGGALRTIGVTSSVPGEGVSTVAMNLAITEATSGGKNVLLVDANEARPSIARLINGDRDMPAADEDAESYFDCAALATSIPTLSIVKIGVHAEGRRAWSGSHSRREYLAQAAAACDLVIVDLPAATASSPCYEWAPLVDGVLLVLEAERASAETALQVKRRLIESGSRLVGVVLNKRTDNAG